MAAQPKVTVQDFEAFIELPENSDRLFELIGGEIVEVVSNGYTPEAEPQKFTISDTLDGGHVLPGFTLAVKDIFVE